MEELYRGKLVRLTAEDPGANARFQMDWQRDSELNRLANDEPAYMWSEKKNKEKFEKRVEDGPDERYFSFLIHSLAADRVIGFINLRVDWQNADAMIGIQIGEREFLGKGFGTEAMRLVVRFAFHELNLRRVTLGVSDFNLRAVKSYEKVGFKREGTVRGDSLREGRRTNSFYMGLLYEEWASMQAGRR